MLGLLVCLAAAGLQTALAVPAFPGGVDVVQPDGTKFRLHLRGDEFFSWHETEDGYAVVKDATDNFWKFAQPAPGQAAFRAIPGARVGSADPARYGARPHALPDASALAPIEQGRQSRRRGAPAEAPVPKTATTKSQATDSTDPAPDTPPDQPPANIPVAGTKTIRNIVILACFSNHWNAGASTVYSTNGMVDITTYSNLFNQVGYTNDGAVGSVRDYYTEVSYGKLTVQSIITPWVQLPQSETYYGGDGSGTDTNAAQMVTDAINAAAAAGFSFAQGDSDSDGWVDCLTVIHSGRGQEYSGNPSTCIWSHQGSMSAMITTNGVSLYRYHTEPALRGWTTDTPAITRIGVCCHEMGHFFGLPDLYDYSSTTYGLGSWSIMASGSWNGSDGKRPAHFDAWCKCFLGFVNPVQVHSQLGLPLARVEDNRSVGFLRDGLTNGEYFLIENRAKTGFDNDSAIYAGLVIYHVDSKSANNDLGSWAHPVVKIEEADGDNSLGSKAASSEAGDVWTSTSGLTGGFKDQTTSQSANAMMYQAAQYLRTNAAASYSYNTLSNFSAAATNMTCDLTSLKTVVRSQSTNAPSYLVTWAPCSQATQYELQEGVKTTLTNLFDGAEDEDAMYDNWYLGGTVKRDSGGKRTGTYSYAMHQYYSSKWGSSVQSLTLRKPFKVLSSTVISFYYLSHLATGSGYLQCQISNDGGNTWKTLGSYSGYVNSWTGASFNYTAMSAQGISAGDSCIIRFIADFERASGWSTFPGYGYALDDISIAGTEIAGYTGWSSLSTNVTSTTYTVSGKSSGVYAYRVRAYANSVWQGFGTEGEASVTLPVIASFAGTPTNGAAPLAVTFTNLSSGATNYSWAFGDGQTSTNANPVNTYSNAGTYSVTLTAIGAGGTNTLTLTNYVVALQPVVAGFTGAPTNGVAPLTVTFTNLSSGATNYSWAFGDGQTSTNVNPVNTYSNVGTYSVTLTAIGAGGTNAVTRTNYVVALQPVVAGFTGAPTNGVAPLTVALTNLSSGATNYTWAFGDGNATTNADPVNVFTNPGTYSITLTAVGRAGTNALTRTNYIVVAHPAPIADFVADLTNGIAPLTVTFTNLSTGATNYAWDFGDGSAATNADPVNVFTNPGTYSVTLTAGGPGGTNSFTRTNYIVVAHPAPVADFVADLTNGIAPLTVTFTNLSTGATNYAWDFGDGSAATNADPVNVFTNPGTYSVTLTAGGPGGTNSFTRTNYIVVAHPAPVADFVADLTNGIAPLTVTFTNLSTGATNYAWDFGDGSAATNADPVNVFTNPGTYSVTLTTGGPGGTNSFTRTNYIVVAHPAPVADFVADLTNGIAPLTVTFTNLSTGATEYAWDFGDGNLTTNTDPVNVFTNPGTYSITLTAVGRAGTNALTRTNYIVVAHPAPVADFVADLTNGVAPLTVTFTNLSTGATEFAWDFGDGNASTNAEPVNVFTNPGTYSVTLTAVGPGGTNALTRTNYIVVAHPAPVADFVAYLTNGVAPLTVTFTNLSTGATEYAWDFGDGNATTNADPLNVFTNPGTYSVTLTAVGPGGANALTRTNYIVVAHPAPVADFVANLTNGIAPLTVTFTNLSTGATDYAWDFGDGNATTNADPVNVFTNPGTYSVTLTAVGPGGTNALTRTNYIVVAVPPPPPDVLLVAPAFTLGGFQFAVSNLDGTPITPAQQSKMNVLASSDVHLALSNWLKLTNTTWLTNGVLQVVDPDTPVSPRRFYRVEQAP